MSPEEFIEKHGFPGTPPGDRMAASLEAVIQTAVSDTLRNLAREHSDLNAVLYVDEDAGGKPVRVSDIYLADAARVGC